MGLPATVGVESEMVLRPPRMLVVAIVLGAFLGMVDATLVAVALAPLAAHFAVTVAAAQETLGVYLITVTATVPTLGRLGDRVGRSRAYVAAFSVFIAGSALAAVSPSFGVLLAARAVQAVGGGMLTAGSLALIAEHAPRRRTGRTVALLVVTQAVAGLVGPPLGGAFVALWGWQSVFWAGVPLAGMGIVLTLRHVPGGRPAAGDAGGRSSVDVAGAVALAVVLLGVAAGVASLAGPLPGGVPVPAWGGVAVVGLVALAVVEGRAARPVVDPRLFGESRFRLAALATLLSTGTLMSCFAVLPYWLEDAHGASPLLAGLAFLPIGAGLAATSRRGGAMGDQGRTRHATVLGMVVAAVGLGVCALAALASLWALLLVGLLVLGCGNGLFSSPNTAAAMSVAPRDALGGAAGFLSTARNAGVIVGLGAAGALYTALVQRHGRTAGDHAAALTFVAAAAICCCVAMLAERAYRVA